MADSPQSRSQADPSSGGRLWLAVGVIVILLVADWFYGSLTRGLILGQANVVVTTDPPGAAVLADTQLLGETPLSAASLLPGSYVLRVEHPYYEPVRESVTLARGELFSRDLQLVQGSGDLNLVSNPRGATIALNGVGRDERTPATLLGLPAGRYDVELAIYGRKTLRESVEVLPGKQAELNGELNRVPMGILSIAVTPGAVADQASVQLSGAQEAYQHSSELVYMEGMSLPLGSYELQVSAPGYGAHQQTIEIRRGPNRFAVELQQQLGRLSVTVTPATARVTVRAAGETRSYAGPETLPVGSVTVSASKLGYRSRSKRVELTESGATVALTLPKFDVTVGRVFRDTLRSGGQAPELVVLAAGSFRMGDVSGLGAKDEQPVHSVQLRTPFAMGVREVSNREWRQQFNEPGDDNPATDMTREQIKTYLAWLRRETGSRYRLATEAEWEYAARAGSDSAYGAAANADELCRVANVADASLKTKYRTWQTVACDDGFVRLAPTGSFAPNAFGLYDMLGNASEWVADCWNGNYQGAPADGRQWGRNCSSWVERGGAWDSAASAARVSFRAPGTRASGDRGFRLVREL